MYRYPPPKLTKEGWSILCQLMFWPFSWATLQACYTQLAYKTDVTGYIDINEPRRLCGAKIHRDLHELISASANQ